MPYKSPVKKGTSWVLPKKGGGFSKSKSGKIRRFRSRQAALKYAQYNNALEHGWKPTKKR